MTRAPYNTNGTVLEHGNTQGALSMEDPVEYTRTLSSVPDLSQAHLQQLTQGSGIAP